MQTVVVEIYFHPSIDEKTVQFFGLPGRILVQVGGI